MKQARLKKTPGKRKIDNPPLEKGGQGGFESFQVKIVKFIDLMRGTPRTFKKVFIVWVVFILIFDVIQSRAEAHFLIDKIYLFWTIFGLAGCFVLIKVAKGLAHTVLGKDEGYYG